MNLLCVNICDGKNISWKVTTFGSNYAQTLQDHNKLSCEKFAYFMSLRSSYLTLSCEDIYIIEPYSPHRFCRQFRFYQDLPGNALEIKENVSLENFRSCTCYRTSDFALIPVVFGDFASQVTNHYRE